MLIQSSHKLINAAVVCMHGKVETHAHELPCDVGDVSHQLIEDTVGSLVFGALNATQALRESCDGLHLERNVSVVAAEACLVTTLLDARRDCIQRLQSTLLGRRREICGAFSVCVGEGACAVRARAGCTHGDSRIAGGAYATVDPPRERVS